MSETIEAVIREWRAMLANDEYEEFTPLEVEHMLNSIATAHDVESRSIANANIAMHNHCKRLEDCFIKATNALRDIAALFEGDWTTRGERVRLIVNEADASPLVFDALAAVFAAQIALKKTRAEWRIRKTHSPSGDGGQPQHQG